MIGPPCCLACITINSPLWFLPYWFVNFASSWNFLFFTPRKFPSPIVQDMWCGIRYLFFLTCYLVIVVKHIFLYTYRDTDAISQKCARHYSYASVLSVIFFFFHVTIFEVVYVDNFPRLFRAIERTGYCFGRSFFVCVFFFFNLFSFIQLKFNLHIFWG